MSQRKQQRESVLLRAIQEVISRGLNDPRVRGLVTVTGVRLSDDGKNATVMISVLPEDRQDLTMHGLKAAGAHIRREAMDKVRLREMPHLEFVTDASLKKQGELLGAINRAVESTREHEQSLGEAGEAAPGVDASVPAGNDHPSPQGGADEQADERPNP